MNLLGGDRSAVASDELTQPVSIKGVLLRWIDGSAEVLLLRNERDEWELPGGRPEADEPPAVCLVREFQEETGLAVRVGSCIHRGVLTISPPHVQRSTSVQILAYGCCLENPADAHGPITLSHEHQSAGWVPVKDLETGSDLPVIYKTAVLHWQCEIDRQLRENA